MTRKRFIKLCMGRLGLSRNEAAAIAESKGITSSAMRRQICGCGMAGSSGRRGWRCPDGKGGTT